MAENNIDMNRDSGNNMSRGRVFIDSNNPGKHNQVIINSYPFIKIPFPPTIDPRDLITKKDDAPSRAPNAFIIYRKAFVEASRANGYSLPMTVISQICSRSWESEPEMVRKEYKRIAKEAGRLRDELCPKVVRRKKREKWNVVSFNNSPISSHSLPDNLTSNLQSIEKVSSLSQLKKKSPAIPMGIENKITQQDITSSSKS
ncbi:MATA-HMG [Gigaspora margarita]|uniref:MATA-HMG n=1 Tax=Gigaspora margarita TaxID=4874 RepID=A0A8H3XBY9_GIGMA|nr:MATA-HMG [Gigaspora margarita]